VLGDARDREPDERQPTGEGRVCTLASEKTTLATTVQALTRAVARPVSTVGMCSR
jgi:hypothetical protein